MKATIVVTVMLALFSAGLAIFLKFYPKWYPEVDVQKRHFKRVVFWVLNLSPYVLSAGGVTLATLYIRFGKLYVLLVAVESVAISSLFILQLTTELLNLGRRSLGTLDKHLNIIGDENDVMKKLIQIAESHEETIYFQGKVLNLIAKDGGLSKQTKEGLGRHFEAFLNQNASTPSTD
jgi:hypothetical protein